MPTHAETIAMRAPQSQAGAVMTDPRLVRVQELRDSIRGIVNRYPGPAQDAELLRESLITSLTYDMAQGRSNFGATLRDPFAPKHIDGLSDEASPDTVYVSPFPKATVVADAAVTFGIPETQEVYVLLERKLKDPKNPQLGLKDEFVLPGGHMEVHAPNEPGANTVRFFDQNLAATVRREIQEETGLALPENYTPASLGLGSDYGIHGDPREHAVADFRHVNMTGSRADFEQLKNSLRPGSDAAELVWVNAKDFEYHPSTPPQPFGSTVSRYHANVMLDGQRKHINVRDDHGDVLDKAVGLARNQLMLERQKQHGFSEPPAAIPSTSLGAQADALHKEQVNALDRFLTQSKGNWQSRVAAQQASPTAGRTH